MILIAPDKFKGTLTAKQAASTIAQQLSDYFCIKAPMADGGEGTASILCAGLEWERRDCYYVNPRTRTAVIDSSAVIGITSESKRNILRSTSAPLGVKVREILKGGCHKVVIGIGGTGVCDGGIGFLEGLDLDKYHTYSDKIVGLSDVKVPLLPALLSEVEIHDAELLSSLPSALMFAKQKGATSADMPLLYQRLKYVQDNYGHGRASDFDGAGGGLGFAIATAIGAPCYSGAEYVLDYYGIDWSKVDAVVTGEGCVDDQSLQGKVVSAVADAAHKHHVPCFIIGGTATIDTHQAQAFCPSIAQVIATDMYYTDCELNEETAAKRLSAAAAEVSRLIGQML